MARRPPKPKPASRPRPRPASGAGRTWLAWLILLALIAGVGVWMYRQRPAHRPAPAPLAASACGPVLADLGGHALARSKSATFTTIEQLQRQAPAGPSSAYRVEARLLQTSAVGDQYRLLWARW